VSLRTKKPLSRPEICEYLAAHGWLYAEGDAAAYPARARALFPADVLTWVQETQPEASGGFIEKPRVQKPGETVLARFAGSNLISAER